MVSPASSRSARMGTAVLLAAAALWGLSYVAMKFALESFHPIVMNFFRMAFAFAPLSLFLPATARRAHYRKGDALLIALMLLCEPCLYEICEALALANTTASQAGMINATLPVFTGVLSYFVLRERLSAGAWLGCLLTIAGAVWLSLAAVSDARSPDPLLGNILMTAGMVVSSCYTILLKKLSARYSPVFLVTLETFAGTLFFLPFLFFSDTGMPLKDASALSWASAAFLGTGVSCGAFILHGIGVSRLGASRANICMNMIPVFTIVFGMLILGERMLPSQWLASAIVFTGVFLSRKS